MSFNVLFMAHAPDADWHQHQSLIHTGQFKLVSIMVRDQVEALEAAKEAQEAHQIEFILLCPGFTHEDVAELRQAFDGQIGVAVARGDGPSSLISAEARRRAYQ